MTEQDDEATPWDDLASGEWRGSSGYWEPVAHQARYRQRSLLGEGGMGRVVVADDTVLRREVALKEALGAPDGPEARRLRREARITAALDHPGIVPVYDLGEDAEGRPHYVMRLVRGRSLGDAIAAAGTYEERLPLVRSFLSACEAVAFAHEAGVVHRDLKPENILVGPWGETQVMDWGLARTLDDDGWDAVVSRDFRTRAGAILGTPAYMSPEQASGEEVGPAADVWALGAVLYEVLSGQRPFRGPSQREMIAQILSGAQPPIASLVPDVDPSLAAIVERALARDPAARYADAGAMARALEDWFDGRRRRAGPVRANSIVPWLLSVLVALGVGWFLAGVSEKGAQDVHLIQESLVVQGHAALAKGDRIGAERLAARALRRGDHPGARGILAATGPAPSPRLLRSFVMEGCERGFLAAAEGFVVCSGPERLARHDLDGTERWTVPSAVERVFVGAGGEVAAARVERGVRWVPFEGATGRAITRYRMNFRPSYPRGGLSLDPLVFVTLQNGRENEFFESRIGDNAAGVVRRGCEARGGIEFVLYEQSQSHVLVCADRSVVRSGDGAPEELLPATGRDSIAWTGDVDPTGRWLLLGEVEGGVELLDLVERRRVLLVQSSTRMIRGVALDPALARFAAVDTAGDAWIGAVADPEARYRLPGSVDGVDFDPSGRLVVSRGSRVEIWDAPLPAATRRSQQQGVLAMDWGREGLAVAALDLVRYGPDLTPGPRLRAEDLPDPEVQEIRRGEIRTVQWADEGLLVAGQRVGALRVSTDLQDIVQLERSAVGAYPLASGYRLLFGALGQDPTFLRPDGGVVDGSWVPGFNGLDAQVSPDGRRALLSGRDGSLLVVEDGDPPKVKPVPEPGARSAALSGDGETLYFVTADGVSMRRTWVEGGPDRVLAPGLSGTLHLLPDERTLLVGTMAGEVHALALPDGRTRMVLQAHERRVSDVALSPDGSRLATGSWDRSIALWDLTVLDASAEELVARVEERWAGVP